jgi:hypothetical protein
MGISQILLKIYKLKLINIINNIKKLLPKNMFTEAMIISKF